MTKSVKHILERELAKQKTTNYVLIYDGEHIVVVVISRVEYRLAENQRALDNYQEATRPSWHKKVMGA